MFSVHSHRSGGLVRLALFHPTQELYLLGAVAARKHATMHVPLVAHSPTHPPTHTLRERQLHKHFWSFSPLTHSHARAVKRWPPKPGLPIICQPTHTSTHAPAHIYPHTPPHIHPHTCTYAHTPTHTSTLTHAGRRRPPKPRLPSIRQQAPSRTWAPKLRFAHTRPAAHPLPLAIRSIHAPRPPAPPATVTLLPAPLHIQPPTQAAAAAAAAPAGCGRRKPGQQQQQQQQHTQHGCSRAPRALRCCAAPCQRPGF